MSRQKERHSTHPGPTFGAPAGVRVTSRSNRPFSRWKILLTARGLFWVCVLSSGIGVWADSRQALQNATSLVQQGRLDEADKQARLALSDPDTRAVACSVLGTIRLQQRRLAESATFLQEAIRLEPHLLGARLSLAEVYSLQNKPQQASAMYRQVLDLDSSNLTARLALARSEADKGNYRQSLELARPAFDHLKRSPDGLFLLSTDYLQLGDREAASALAKEWLQLPNPSPSYSIKFAVLLAKGGVTDQAVEILENTRHAGGSSYELVFNLAGVYLLKKDPAKALEYYDQALIFNPKSVPATKQAAGITEGQGELEHALSYWIRAKELEPNDPEVLLGFGRVCLKMDLLEDAEPALTRAASLRPKDPAYQYILASAKVGKKQFAAAQELLERLVQQQPAEAQFHYALGSVLYLQGRLPEAASQLQESIRLQPDQLAPYYYMALVARDQGNEAEAIQRLEDLLRRYPDHALSCEALGSLLMSAHRYPEAESNLEKAVRLNPKSVKANYQLGLLLARMGKKEDSEKQLALSKSLREEDEANSRLQLRLLDPDR